MGYHSWMFKGDVRSYYLTGIPYIRDSRSRAGVDVVFDEERCTRLAQADNRGYQIRKWTSGGYDFDTVGSIGSDGGKG